MLIINARKLIIGAVMFMFAQHMEIKYYKQENEELRKKMKHR